MGHYESHSARLGRSVSRHSRLALSGAPPAGGRRTGQSRMGGFGQQPAREVLQTDRGRQETTRRGMGDLEAVLRRGRTGPARRLITHGRNVARVVYSLIETARGRE